MVSVALSLKRRPLWVDCWDDVMIGNRRYSNIGSTPTYHTVNRLSVPEAAMKVNRKDFFHQIMAQGQWVVKKLDFKMADSVTLRCRVTGAGMGYLYASFDNGEGGSLLVIKKVTPGIHDIKFKVPYPTLHNFKIGISTTVPKGYSIDRLSNEDRYKLRTNSMMVSQSTPMYETPGIGFAGLGATLNENIEPSTARGGQDSSNNPYWNGDWNNFSWDNGYSGSAETINVASGVKSPKVLGSYNGYYASRMSYAVAKFDSQDRFLGWDVNESSDFTLPAGVPICVIMQFFVLPEETDDGGNISGPADREMVRPYWRYAHDYQIPASKFHFMDRELSASKQIKRPSSINHRWDKDHKGPIHEVGRTYVCDTRHEGSGFKINNELKDARELACKLEWYNEQYKTWSAPSVAPQFIPKTNQDGFTKAIFRIPRQLDPVTDKDRLEELKEYGVDYTYETTKNCFPAAIPSRERFHPSGIGYNILGRPVDEGGSINTRLEYKDDGITYYACNKMRLDLWFEYGNHPYAGAAGYLKGDPFPGPVQALTPDLYFGDPEKMARMNNPELMNAFYPVGGFKTGGIIVAIGRGMHTRASFTLSKSSTYKSAFSSQDPHPDGSGIGTKPEAVFPPKGIILTTDLEDDRVTVQEEGLLATWKAKFGEPLTAGFFSQYSLKDQIPEKPTHYRIKDKDSGITIEAPYQIVYFEVGPEYDGPYADYEIVETIEKDAEGNEVKVTKLKLNQPEGKPYALKASDSLWLHCRTPYAKYVKQAIDILDEVEEQRQFTDAGLTDAEALIYNELNNAPDESTAAIAEINQEEQRLKMQAIHDGTYEEQFGDPEEPGEPDEPKLPSGAKYIRSGDKWRMNPKHYARESQLKDAGFLGGIKNALSGFTNSRDFYVEDVTDKWGASGQSGLNGLGKAFSDYVTPDSADEDLDQVISDSGYLMSALVNSAGAGAGAVYNVLNGDLDKATDKFDYIVDELTDQRPDYGDDDDILEIAADLAWNITQVTGNTIVGAVGDGADLVGDITGLGGYSSNGLGDFYDKAADVGEGVGKFVRGTARGLTPDALTEGLDNGIGALTDKFMERPVLYTGLAIAAAPLLIPGIGGAYARNVTALAKGTIGLVPAGFKALTGTVGNVASGAIVETKRIGDSIVGNPKSRGTAASRRRSKRR